MNDRVEGGLGQDRIYLAESFIPKPNWRISFGNKDDGFTIQAHFKSYPNRFQRWMLSKFFGMHWRKL
jgi:hypothetical protein